jgi:DNA-binding GntR family transcriptional regulator
MTLTSDKELTHKPLKEEVYDTLHRQIIAGKYKPGDWLRQEDIASQIGVSMTPVREALDLLVAAGLAERVAYRGVRVREMSARDIVDAYELRLVLETLVAREAALRITPEQIAELERIIMEIGKHVRLNEMPLERQLSREFHSVLAEATGNNLLIKLYSVVANTFPDWLLYEAVYRKPGLMVDSFTQTCDEFKAILDALKKGNPNLAAQKTMDHVLDSGKWMEEYLDIPSELLREKETLAKSMIEKTK